MDRQIFDPGQILAILGIHPEDDGNGLIFLSKLGDGGAGQLHLQACGEGLIVDAEHAGLILVDHQAHDFVLFVPIQIDVGKIGLRRHDFAHFVGDLARLLVIDAADPEHHRIRGRGTGLQQFNMAANFGKFLGQQGRYLLLKVIPRRQIFGDKHKLGIVAVGQGRITGQHKPGSAFADMIAETGQIRIAFKFFGKTIGLRLRGPNGRSFRQGHLYQDFLTQGRREEFLTDKLKKKQGTQKATGRHRENQLSPLQAPGQDAAE